LSNLQLILLIYKWLFTSECAYINPLFYIKDNVIRLEAGEKYITTTSEEIIQIEMSKREKKKN